MSRLPSSIARCLPWLAAWGLACASEARPPTRSTPWPGQGTDAPSSRGDLPEPPAQRLAWIAPESTLPAEYVSAATTLFRQGLADPRGCEYREMVIVTHSVWGHRYLTETHGWVLPGYGKTRFGIGWTGLVYPILCSGNLADLRADVAVAMKGRGLGRWAPEEKTALAWNRLNDVKGCLLLRLGEVGLAREVWKASQLGMHSPDDAPLDARTYQLAKEDPYRSWAATWAWMEYDRALCAHMLGDDTQALHGFRALMKLRPGIAAEMTKREEMLPAAGWMWGDFPVNQDRPLDFLDPVADLLRDQERRLTTQGRPSARQVIAAIHPPQMERIRLLIDDLDQVEVRQFCQPGGLGPSTEDPIVMALIAEGEMAIEPLLKYLESDAANHLTRSVSFSRDFRTVRVLWTVRMPIREILLELMHTARNVIGLPNVSSTGSPQEEAALFRAYWEHYRGSTPEERWYRQLADDECRPEVWLDALERLVEKDEAGHMAGEVLREKSSPSVAELLVKRAEILTRRVRGEPVGSVAMEAQAEKFVLAAMEWDAGPVLPSAAALMRDYPENGGSLAHMATLATARADHGDLPALEEWGRWIVTREPGDLFGRYQEKLTPLFSYPGHPAMQAAAKALLSDPDGKWWRSYREPPFSEDEALRLLVVPEARECWRQSLTDTEKVGTVKVTQVGELSFKTANESSTRGADREAAKLPVGTTQELRRCDQWADRLRTVRGVCAFCPAWPLEKRDTAIAEMRRILAEEGARFKLLGEKERDSLFWAGVRLEPR